MSDVVVGFLALVVVISVLVVVHELGHFLTARRFGMRVEEFSLFYGPVIWRVAKVGATEYNVRAIPFGGFVRIAGMEADDISGGRPILVALRQPRFAEPTSAQDALARLANDTGIDMDATRVSERVRVQLLEAIGSDGLLTSDGRTAMRELSVSRDINTDEHRLIMLALGADERTRDTTQFNQRPIWQRALVILAGPLASLLFGLVVFSAMGVTFGLPTGDVTNQVGNVNVDGAARRAGIRTGDRIAAINGEPITTGTAMVKRIHDSAGQMLTLLVERDGARITMLVTPKATTMEMETGKKITIGLIGIEPVAELKHYGLGESIVFGGRITANYVLRLVGILTDHKQVKENLGGPIAMGQMAVAAQRLGVAHVAMMAGAFSLGLGVFNLLPIPIVDGGHLLLFAIEALRRRRLSPREMHRAQVLGLGILAAIVVFVFFNDISRTIAGRAIQ